MIENCEAKLHEANREAKVLRVERDNAERVARDLYRETDLLRERIAALEALLNSAPVDDFLESVRVEAAHQVERWKAPHDEGKSPGDWFWLLGRLASKAFDAAARDDGPKALHHVITSAAVLLNWHDRLSGHDRGFRPGTAEPDA